MWLNFDPESMAAYYAEGQLLDEEIDDEPLPVRCRYCRKSEFHWEQLGGKWRLFTENGHLHSCKGSKPIPVRFGGYRGL